MRVKMGQEMWIVNGELVMPWLKFRDGTPARGLARPKPLTISEGTEVDLYWPGEPGILERAEYSIRVAQAGDGAGSTEADSGTDFQGANGRGTPDDLAAKLKALDDVMNFNVLSGEDERDELLAEMGHARLAPEDECCCFCKGCGAGRHCRDHRCYPLHD